MIVNKDNVEYFSDFISAYKKYSKDESEDNLTYVLCQSTALTLCNMVGKDKHITLRKLFEFAWEERKKFNDIYSEKE